MMQLKIVKKDMNDINEDDEDADFFVEPMYWENFWNLGWIITALLLQIRVFFFSLFYVNSQEQHKVHWCG